MRSSRHQLDQLEEPALESFPLTEPATEVEPWLEIRELGRLGLTCKFFQDQLSIARAAHYVVVEPSVVEIKKMLDAASPELLKKLLCKKISKVATKSGTGRTFNNSSLLQLPFIAGDYEMCQVLEPYYERAFGSVDAAREEMRRQFEEKSAESEEEKQQREARDLEIKNQLASLLATVIQAISNERFDLENENGKWTLSDGTLQTIAAFRAALDLLHPKIIDKDKLFRLNTIQVAYDAYAQVAAQWGYDYKRCALFEDGVLSSVLCYLPENDAERCSQGLYYLQKDPPEPFTRSLKLRGTNINFYDSLRAASSDFSNLSGSCVDIVFGTAGLSREYFMLDGAAARARTRFNTYVEQKQRTDSAYAARWTTPCVSASNLVK